MTPFRKSANAGFRRSNARWRSAAFFTALALFACLAADVSAAPAVVLKHRVTGEETLMDIARRYDLGFVELRGANPGVDPWRPGEGLEIVLPNLHLEPRGPHSNAAYRGIVINLADMRLYLYRGADAPVLSYPLGIGRDGWETPTGVTQIVRKRANPVWIPPESIRARDPRLPARVAPGPDNPLGAYALSLGWEGYVIHGTNKPDGVGRRVSHGCLRLYPEDIEELFGLVSVGTPVTIVDQPIKLAWIDEQLYLEVHPSQQQAMEIELTGGFSPEPLEGINRMIDDIPGIGAIEIDWPLLERVTQERQGLAVRISR